MTPIDPTLHTTAVAALEDALNRALDLDPATRDKLAPLAGKVFCLQCTRPELELYLAPGARRLRLAGHWDGEVTTTLRGAAGEFAELAGAEDPAVALINGDLELEGESAPMIELQTALSGLEPDWEAPLVNSLGDVAGHQLAEMLRGLFGWGRQASRGLVRQLEEFIHEEARLAPSRLEVEDFKRDVEQLRLRVERIGSRLRRFVEERAN